MDWIRGKDLTSVYPIQRTYAYELLKQFRAESDGWIKDGRILIINKKEFEEWWKQRSKSRL